MNRRTFLSIAAGSPLVFGLRGLLAQDPKPQDPDYVAEALKRMKSTRRYGVILVIPSDAAGQKRLGEGLLARLPTGSKAGTEGFDLFCATVFVCATEACASEFIQGRQEGEGIHRILVSPDGNRVDSDRVKLEVLENAGEFRESFSKFIHGGDGARLREHAAVIEKAMPEELKKAAAQLGGDPAEERAAMALLKARADSIAPWLVRKNLEKDGAPFRAVLWEYYLEQAYNEPEPILPFGIRVKRVAVEDPCPPCGMAAYRASAYRFMGFYGK